MKGRPIRKYALWSVVGVLLLQLVTLSPVRGAGVWRRAASLATARSGHTATLLSGPACRRRPAPAYCGDVLVAGGTTFKKGASATTSSVELYDAASPRWIAARPLSVARSGHTATVLTGRSCTGRPVPEWCGKVLVAGGSPTGSAEVYDPRSGRWTATGSMRSARAGHTATSLQDGRVLVVGGSGDAHGEIYDPVTGRWTDTAPLNLPRRDGHTATRLEDGRVLVAGGRGSDGNSTGSAEIYDAAAGTWSEAGAMAVPRSGHTATLLKDGRAAVLGGSDGSSFRRSLEIFDPTAESGAGAWSAGDSMAVPRTSHTASLLGDGRILAAGGGKDDLGSVEVYQPAADEWTVTGSLKTARYQHRATMLDAPGCRPRCGEVLVVGGVGSGGRLLPATEVYDPAADPAPGRVTGLSARAEGAREIELAFSASGSDGRAAPATGDYVIKQSTRPIVGERRFARARSLCGGVCRFSPDKVGDRITLTVKKLTPGTTYFYALRGKDEAGNLGPISRWARATTRSVPLGRVRDLSARAVSATEVELRLSAASHEGTDAPVRKYVVRQSNAPMRNAQEFRRARSLCGGVCSFSPRGVGDRIGLRVTGLSPRTSYHYAVRATDDRGAFGPLSRSVKARTWADEVPPERVREVSAKALSPTRIRLAFRAAGSNGSKGPPAGKYVVKESGVPVSNERRFRRARSLCGGVCRYSPARVGDKLTLLVTHLCPRTTYHYAVRAMDTAGNLGPRSRSFRARTRAFRARTRGRRGSC